MSVRGLGKGRVQFVLEYVMEVPEGSCSGMASTASPCRRGEH